jgi:hypothetical protein
MMKIESLVMKRQILLQASSRIVNKPGSIEQMMLHPKQEKSSRSIPTSLVVINQSAIQISTQ